MDDSRMADDATPSLHDELLQTVQDMVRTGKYLLSRMRNFDTRGACVLKIVLNVYLLLKIPTASPR